MWYACEVDRGYFFAEKMEMAKTETTGKKMNDDNRRYLVGYWIMATLVEFGAAMTRLRKHVESQDDGIERLIGFITNGGSKCLS